MNCVLCKSDLKRGNVNHVVDLEDKIIVIKEVPANICEQCGEYFLDNEVALNIETFIEKAKKNKAEILVVKYTDGSIKPYDKSIRSKRFNCRKKYKSKNKKALNFIREWR